MSARRFVLAIVAALSSAFCVGPFAAQIVASVRSEAATFSGRSGALGLDAYRSALFGHALLRALVNSALVAAVTTAFALLVGASAAFAIAKLRFPGRGALLAIALAVSAFPPIATVSPLYLLLRALGLLDRPLGLVVPYVTFTLPLAIWILVRFFRQVPDELWQAARVDGCTPFRAFRSVLLPVVAPGLATTAILVFVFAWNELLWALTFTTSPDARTAPVAIALFSSEHREPFAEIAAASVLATLPLVVATLAFQRRVVEGLTAGAVKG